LKNQRSSIETKLKLNTQSNAENPTKETNRSYHEDDTVNSMNVEQRFGDVKNRAYAVKRHMRDEEIKYRMFADVLENEVHRHSPRKAKRHSLINVESASAVEDPDQNMARLKSELLESEALYRKDIQEKISLSLFAADKFFKIHKQSEAPQQIEPEIVRMNASKQLYELKPKSKSPVRHQKSFSPKQQEDARTQAMQTFINSKSYFNQESARVSHDVVSSIVSSRVNLHD